MPVTITDNYGTTITLAMPDEREALSLNLAGGGSVAIGAARPLAIGPVGMLRIGVSVAALGAWVAARLAATRVFVGAAAVGAAVAARTAPASVGVALPAAGAAVATRMAIARVGVGGETIGVAGSAPGAGINARTAVARVGATSDALGAAVLGRLGVSGVGVAVAATGAQIEARDATAGAGVDVSAPSARIVARTAVSRVGVSAAALGEEAVVSAFLLDTYPGAKGAWSLRKLSSSTTNVVRVRRSSDNAEDDFTAAEVDDGTLLTWVGTGATDNGLVTTWYDQSGNARHATQATAGDQPKIVDAGILVTEDGNICLDFPGAFVKATNIYTPTFTEAYITYVYSNEFNDDDSRPIGIGDGNYNSPTAVLAPDSTLRFNDGFEDWDQEGYLTKEFAIQSLQQIGATYRGWQNGTEVIFTDRGTQSQRDNGISIGKNSNFTMSGKVAEVIAYEQNQSASRAALETEIATYYGITMT